MKFNYKSNTKGNGMRRASYMRTVLMLLLLTILAPTTKAMTVIEQADSAYNARNYRQALSLYNQELDSKGASTELYYNIGNANYRLGRIGRAIVSYERALKLDPSNADARANLNFVNSTLKGLPEDGSSFLSNIHAGIVSVASANVWSVVAAVLFIVLLGMAATYIFSSNTTMRKIGFFGGFVVLFFFIYSFVIAWQTSRAIENNDTGIVISRTARISSTPGTTKSNDEKTISIPEGSKIQIVDSLATPNDPVTAMWYNVVLNNSTQAWIDASSVEQI